MTCVDPKFAWNHGDFQQEIANTWLGDGRAWSREQRVDDETWTDHVDAGRRCSRSSACSDATSNDGRVITQILERQGDAEGARTSTATRPAELGAIYKQINAPFGQFGTRHADGVDVALKQPDTAAGNLKYDSIETRSPT